METITYTDTAVMEIMRKCFGLIGKQKIVDVRDGFGDFVCFESNAIGGYGETLSFHYYDDAAGKNQFIYDFNYCAETDYTDVEFVGRHFTFTR